MRKSGFLLAVFILWAAAAFAQTPRPLSLATGPAGGTYARIGEDIKNVAAKEGLSLALKTTTGTFENIELLGKGEADLGIVQ